MTTGRRGHSGREVVGLRWEGAVVGGLAGGCGSLKAGDLGRSLREEVVR